MKQYQGGKNYFIANNNFTNHIRILLNAVAKKCCVLFKILVTSAYFGITLFFLLSSLSHARLLGYNISMR